ncbi:MAG: hypothetical protein COB16_16810 [Rhodobacteraceae bacterium]|nr:MAG: hypothetical protein COB16_16810 [Paracoccaceae bacterium]
MIKNTLAAAVIAVGVTPAAAEFSKYQCIFAEGKVARPTPTEIVFTVDTFSQFGRLEALTIPGVTTSDNPIRVVRNTKNVLLVEWFGHDYEFTAEAIDKGAKKWASYLDVKWPKHRFSVFLKKRNMEALTRSESTGHRPLSGHSSGSCIRLE